MTEINLVGNIQRMYKRMLTETQRQVVEVLMQEFDKSKNVIKQNWIYQGMVPEDHQARVVEVCQNALLAEIKKTQEICHAS